MFLRIDLMPDILQQVISLYAPCQTEIAAVLHQCPNNVLELCVKAQALAEVVTQFAIKLHRLPVSA